VRDLHDILQRALWFGALGVVAVIIIVIVANA
jgi:hypothetical protein